MSLIWQVCKPTRLVTASPVLRSFLRSSLFFLFVQTHYSHAIRYATKNRRRRPGEIGLIAARTWPPAMRTAPKWNSSSGWMARLSQTHLDTAKPPIWYPFQGIPETESWIRIQSLPRTKPRESITTVLRRSSAEEKTVRKSRVHNPFST